MTLKYLSNEYFKEFIATSKTLCKGLDLKYSTW